MYTYIVPWVYKNVSSKRIGRVTGYYLIIFFSSFFFSFFYLSACARVCVCVRKIIYKNEKEKRGKETHCFYTPDNLSKNS